MRGLSRGAPLYIGRKDKIGPFSFRHKGNFGFDQHQNLCRKLVKAFLSPLLAHGRRLVRQEIVGGGRALRLQGAVNPKAFVAFKKILTGLSGLLPRPLDVVFEGLRGNGIDLQRAFDQPVKKFAA